MYGHPQVPQVPPPPRSSLSGGRIALLALFSVLALLSCGFLSWAPLLRLACVTRRARDWVLCGVLFAGSAGLFAYAAATGDQEPTTQESFVAVGVMVALVAGSITYYLFGEIRHAERAHRARAGGVHVREQRRRRDRPARGRAAEPVRRPRRAPVRRPGAGHARRPGARHPVPQPPAPASTRSAPSSTS